MKRASSLSLDSAASLYCIPKKAADKKLSPYQAQHAPRKNREGLAMGAAERSVLV